MASICYTTVKSRVIRVTRLNSCGEPLAGPRSSLVTGGFVRVESALDIEDGEVFEQRDAWGDYCTNEKDDPKIKGADVTIDFCRVDPDLYDLISGARLIVAGEDSDVAAEGTSIGFAFGVDTVPGGFALEAWTKQGGAACGDSGDPLWIYTVWPFLKGGRPGNLVLERGVATFPQTARAEGASAAWGDGPYATGVLTMQAGEVFGQVVTDVQPPTAACGAGVLTLA